MQSELPTEPLIPPVPQTSEQSLALRALDPLCSQGFVAVKTVYLKLRPKWQIIVKKNGTVEDLGAYDLHGENTQMLAVSWSGQPPLFLQIITGQEGQKSIWASSDVYALSHFMRLKQAHSPVN